MNKENFIKKYNLRELTSNDGICIDLIYATNNNFTHKKLYNDTTCLLRENTAEKLLKANKELLQYGYKIKIWDAFRPIKIQEKMWKLYPNENFVANPKSGKSNHCKASAIDVTLCTLDNKDLPMPTEFDHFGIESYRNYYTNLPKNIQENVKLLEEIMKKNGFDPLFSEWWHFNDIDNYDIIYELYN